MSRGASPTPAGDPFPTLPVLPSGTYTLNGKVSGSANVQITDLTGNKALGSVVVSYTNYSDQSGYTINGTGAECVGFVSQQLCHRSRESDFKRSPARNQGH